MKKFILVLFCTLAAGQAMANTSCSNATRSLTFVSGSGSGPFASKGGYTFSILGETFSLPEKSNDQFQVNVSKESLLSNEENEHFGLGGRMLIKVKHYTAMVEISRKDGKPIYDKSIVDGPKYDTLSEWMICQEMTTERK